MTRRSLARTIAGPIAFAEAEQRIAEEVELPAGYCCATRCSSSPAFRSRPW
jgi:hypothetical protein